MIATARKGKRYRATIRLGFFEGAASNATIAGKLVDAGFADVRVTGSGRDRVAEATWPGATATAELPSQITKVTELP